MSPSKLNEEGQPKEAGVFPVPSTARWPHESDPLPSFLAPPVLAAPLWCCCPGSRDPVQGDEEGDGADYCEGRNPAIRAACLLAPAEEACAFGSARRPREDWIR